MIVDAFEVTAELFAAFEEDTSSNDPGLQPPKQYPPNHQLYIKATAWKSSTYAQMEWPYNAPIEKSYFEAYVDKDDDKKPLSQVNKVSLKFVAFDLEERKRLYSNAWLKRYVISTLPNDGVVISKEMYDAMEAGALDHEEADSGRQITLVHTIQFLLLNHFYL